MSGSSTITVFEDTTDWLSNVGDHEANLTALRDLVGRHNFMLQTDGSLRIMHYVGFFQRGNTRVQILPKLYRNTSAAAREIEAEQSLAFVYRLLHWTGFLGHKSLAPQSVNTSDTDLLEIFISIFITAFNQQFQRKVIRRYEERIENSQIIKGKILVGQTIARNPILRHRHVIAADEYSINNHLNRVFKSIIHLLLRISRQRENKKQLVIALDYLADVDLIRLTSEDFRAVRFTRLNREFEPLFNLARLFFHNQQPGLAEGSEHTFAFLVPLHSLFEQFIARILERLSSNELEFRFHTNATYLLSDNGNQKLQLRPDYVAVAGEEIVAVLDAKYKCPWDTNGNASMNDGDVYQLCTYALKYEVAQLYLIYPMFVDAPKREALLTDYQIETASKNISLRVAQADVLQEDFDNIVEDLRGAICDPITGVSRPARPSPEEESEYPWLSDGKSWHFENRLGSHMRKIFADIDNLIRANLNVDGPRYDKKAYISYQRNGHNCIFVRTFSNQLILVFPVKARSMDKSTIARNLRIQEFDGDDSHSEKVNLPSSVNIVHRNETTDRIQIRVKEDFDFRSQAFLEFLEETVKNGVRG